MSDDSAKRCAYTNCNLYDGTADGTLQPDTTIVVEGDRIVEVFKGSPEQSDTSWDTVVDLAGAYVTPGLINAHGHHFGSGKPSSVLGGGGAQKLVLAFARTKAGHAYLDKTVAYNVFTALLSGVTTLRGVGDFHYSDVRVRDRINAGQLPGPRFIVSGPAITVWNGHGAGTFADVADTPEEFAAIVDQRKNNGVDFIKICTTGGVMDSKERGEAGLLRMNVEQTTAVCKRAHQLGMKVASHTESVEGVEVDLLGGVDTVEHGAGLTPELAQRFKESGAADICTISVALAQAALPAEVTKVSEVSAFNAQVVTDRIIQGAKDCLAYGIPVGLGTDAACPFVMHYDMWREVYNFVKHIGVTPQFALHTATLKNAQILGMDDLTGSVEVGKVADFIATKDNPLVDVSALRHIDKVVARGVLYDNAAEQLEGRKLPDVDKVLDDLM